MCEIIGDEGMSGWLLQAQATGGQSTVTFVMLGGMLLIFYFLILRPQKKQQKALDTMRSSLKKGDKVVTAGGIRGKVDSTKEIDGQKIVSLIVDDNVKIEFLSTAITQIAKSTTDTSEKSSNKDK